MKPIAVLVCDTIMSSTFVALPVGGTFQRITRMLVIHLKLTVTVLQGRNRKHGQDFRFLSLINQGEVYL